MTGIDTWFIPTRIIDGSVEADRLMSESNGFVNLQPTRQLVGDKDHRHPTLDLIYRSRDRFRGPLIEVAGRLIKYQHLRPLQQRPRNRNPLPPDNPTPCSPNCV